MKKNAVIIVAMLILCICAGCGNSNISDGNLSDEVIDKINEEYAELQNKYQKRLEEHEAMIMQKEGIWDERYNENIYTNTMSSAELCLSINEKKDMTEEQRMVVLDYYKIWLQSLNDIGDSDYYNGDVTIYAVFYAGDDEVKEVARYKYVNGDIVDISEEEQYQFPASIFENKYKEN